MVRGSCIYLRCAAKCQGSLKGKVAESPTCKFSQPLSELKANGPIQMGCLQQQSSQYHQKWPCNGANVTPPLHSMELLMKIASGSMLDLPRTSTGPGKVAEDRFMGGLGQRRAEGEGWTGGLVLSDNSAHQILSLIFQPSWPPASPEAYTCKIHGMDLRKPIGEQVACQDVHFVFLPLIVCWMAFAHHSMQRTLHWCGYVVWSVCVCGEE